MASKKRVKKSMAKQYHAAAKGQQTELMTIDEEKVDVFEIITDLEKQLEVAFRIKEAQEREIDKLKDRLGKTEEREGVLNKKLKEAKSTLASQRALNSELEFLENEKLESTEKIKSLEDKLKEETSYAKELEEKIEAFNKEIKARDDRMEQVEFELDESNKAVQSFQNKVKGLDAEKHELLNKIEKVNVEIDNVIAERDKYKKESKKAKDSMDEIRQMLADTRAKARAHYYKEKPKKA